MTVGDIIKAVRWCIDEEAVNMASIDDVSAYDFDDGTHTDTGLMNNIIKNKIPAALRWVCLYAPSEQLSTISGGGGGGGTSASIDVIQEDTLTASNNVLTPTKSLIRLLRVKGSGWHRAITDETLIKEDSDEHLQLLDTNGAAATVDRPQASLVNTKVKKVEVWPGDSSSYVLTYIVSPTIDVSSLDDNTQIGVPTAVETSFIYYLAYLLCTAYGDGRASSMFEVATLNLGKSEDKQRQ